VASGPSAASSTSRHPDQPAAVRDRSRTVPTAACSGQENPTNRAFPTATGADSTRRAAGTDPVPGVAPRRGSVAEPEAGRRALSTAPPAPPPAPPAAPPAAGPSTGVSVSWTFLSVPGLILRPPPSDGWAALNRVRASAEAAPAARVRVASERRDRNGTSILQRAAVYRLEVG
jgi:hypothetical protein